MADDQTQKIIAERDTHHTSLLKWWLDFCWRRVCRLPWNVCSRATSHESSSPQKALAIGVQGEAMAETYLKSQGFQILAKNLRTRLGEIDLLALEGETIVFVEVKTRKSNARGRPEEAIHPRKQKQISRVAMALLKSKGWLNRPSRIDVITITGEPESADCELRHYRHAFPSTL